MTRNWIAALMLLGTLVCSSIDAQVAIKGSIVHTMAGPPIRDGVVVIVDGKISAVGKASDIVIPDGFRVLEAPVVTPGLVDAHSVVGIAGMYNQQKGDQEQHEGSEPIQPELRALDAYNPRERLVDWVRGFGVTTVQTGHAPQELIPGQLFIVKTTGDTADDAAIVEFSAVAATLTESAKKDGPASPGTRGKMMALLRAKFIAAQAYQRKMATSDEDKKPERSLRLEALVAVLDKEVPLVLTAQRAQDIASALRFAREFKIDLILDGCAEAYLMVDKIRAAKVPVIIHPTMQRAVGETENLSFETAAKLHHAGILIALQSGYESYVPKTRVVLFEAALAAGNGLGFEGALASITLGAAKILGVDKRVGSLEVGKDGDVALYDGDPFEYTSHCLATVIEGKVVSTGERAR